MTQSKTKATPPNKQDQPKSFELAYEELESIVTRMESSHMTLENSLVAFERGNYLLQFCQKSLADVEQKVEILNERKQLIPFDSEGE